MILCAKKSSQFLAQVISGQVEDFYVQNIVARGWGSTGCQDFICCPIVVVGQKQWAKVYVVRKAGRPVDFDWADNTVAVLGREMRVCDFFLAC